MATNYVTGTPGDDFLGPTAGVNNYTGGAGDDAIDGTDGVNTINFAAGDGVDTVNFAMPRTYQFADFLSAAQQALNDLSSFSGSQYSNAYFASADTSLLYALPPDIANTLAAFQTPQVDADGNEIPGSVSPTDAKAAFQALEDWINTPTSNVVKFGPGITLNDLTFTLGATTPLNSGDATIPTNFSVAINGTEGVVFSMPTTAARLGLQCEGRAHARCADGVAAGFCGSADGRRRAPIGNAARFVAAESGLQSIASGDGEYLSAEPE